MRASSSVVTQGLGRRHTYRRVTGQEYSYLSYLRHSAALDDAFREEALRNIRTQPHVYLYNVARALATLSLQINTSLVSAFQRIQHPGEKVSQTWFWEGGEHERQETAASRAFGLLVAALTALAIVGLIRGAVRRDGFLVVPGLVYSCVALAHAITFMAFNYYYLKLPFLLVFAATGLDALAEHPWTIGVGRRRVSMAVLLEALLVLLAFATAMAVMA